MMGYPATMGASYIPYILSDHTIIPDGFSKYYSEKILYMPHTYFVNDYRQSASHVFHRPLTSREALGLPTDKFVFCNFNQLYKYDPETFDMWIRILKAVPESVLWLLRFPASGAERLQLYAKAQGIDEKRLLFTDVAEKHMHISRAALADLFLDTPLCNGHTTACDALWSGLPMVTLPLVTMASRVAASLCRALECPEMVAASAQEYEERAVHLARHPAAMQDLRAKVAEKRMTSALFDTAGWVRDVEKGMREVMRIELGGESPRDIDIGGLDY